MSPFDPKRTSAAPLSRSLASTLARWLKIADGTSVQATANRCIHSGKFSVDVHGCARADVRLHLDLDLDLDLDRLLLGHGDDLAPRAVTTTPTGRHWMRQLQMCNVRAAMDMVGCASLHWHGIRRYELFGMRGIGSLIGTAELPRAR
jgi:hypothetical protein